MSVSRSVSRGVSPAYSEGSERSHSSSSIISGSTGNPISTPTKAHPLLLPRRSSSSSISHPSDAASIPLVNFAQQGNPTIQINLTRRYSFQLTYAEVLQYACILLTTRELTLFTSSSSSTLTSGSGQQRPKTRRRSSLNAFFFLNILLLFVSLASLGVRKRAEGLGLRRTSLMLCVVLLLFTCLVVGFGTFQTTNWVTDWESTSRRYCPREEYGNVALQVLATSPSECARDIMTSRLDQELVSSTSQILFEAPSKRDDEPFLLNRFCQSITADSQDKRLVRLTTIEDSISRHSVIIECNGESTNDT